MIRTLTGKITYIGNNSVVIDVNGVGYLVATSTLINNYQLGETITLQTYLAVRETALDLYGFGERSELEMFELLLNVPKIGPKSASQILAQASVPLLIESAHKNDSTYLHKLSGIGKKTCENIIQYLSGKVDALPKMGGLISPSQTLNQIQTDAIDALVSLGYDLNTSRETIKNFETEGATVNSLVTQALRQIN